MARPTPRALSAPEPGAMARARLALAAGIALAAVFAIIDWQVATDDAVIATVVVAPFATALLAPPRATAVVAVAAALLALLSGSWNDNTGEVGYSLRLVAVSVGGWVAVLAASARERAVSSARRFEQLSVALNGLAEAVTIQSAAGELVYANDAAARLLGAESAAKLIATPPGQFVDRFESFHEDGSPVSADALPGHRVLAGERADPLTVRAIDQSTGEERWRIVRASVVPGPANTRFAVNVIEDVTELKRAELAQRLLADAGDVLSSSLDYEATLQRVAELTVPELADWCGVSLPDGRGCLRQVAVAHTDPEKVALASRLGERYPVSIDAETGTAAVLRSGRTELINELPDDMLASLADDAEHFELLRALGMRAALIVPMRGSHEVLGTLQLVSAESGRTFSEADVKLAEELARRAASAVEHSRLYTERSHIARTLQSGLLPPVLPRMPGWSSAALYRPAGPENLVGGDFYDAFAVGGGWLVIVGDVAGHGPEAASLTAQARHTLRTAAMLSGSAGAALRQLNDELLARRPEMALCTVTCAFLSDTGGGAQVEVFCAGSPPALLVDDGSVSEACASGPLLGAWADAEWVGKTTRLAAGSTLVLYTDGIEDARGEDDRFGADRLELTLAAASDAGDAVQRIDSALAGFERGDQADDTAVIAVSPV